MTLSDRQAFPLAVVALPVAAPSSTHQGTDALAHDVAEDLPVAPAPDVFPVCNFFGIVVQVLRSELVDLADLKTAEARENRLGKLAGRAIVGAVLPPVIHPAKLVLGRQPVRRIGFVGTNDATVGDAGRRQLADIGLLLILSDERERLPGPGATGRALPPTYPPST